MMVKNLVAELIRPGHKPDQTAKIIADVLGCTEKTARNKLNEISAFTVPEALKINEQIFKNEFEIRYLFDTRVSDKLA
ncbi:hypothetical protein SATMO3_22440 [Sporomusa aerivorans]